MNWLQYFKLVDKRKQMFTSLAVIFILIHLYFFYLQPYFKDNPEIICDNLKVICGVNGTVEDDGIFFKNSSMGESSLDISTNMTNATNLTPNNITNNGDSLDIQMIDEKAELMINTSNLTGNATNTTKITKPKRKTSFPSYVIFQCTLDCKQNKITAALYRAHMSPLFIFYDILLAFILSYMVFGLNYWKLEIKKPGGKEEGKPEEKKQDKK